MNFLYRHRKSLGFFVSAIIFGNIAGYVESCDNWLQNTLIVWGVASFCGFVATYCMVIEEA